MPGYAREVADRWHREVPGARWFRADLHVHTLDDHPTGRIRWDGPRSRPITTEVLGQYARALLRAAAARGVEVLGLTPHAVYCGGRTDLSAVWKIVETWNTERDDDGVPFREKVYAVFPGFEAALADGARGVHLIFLFDPEIGHAGLLRAFHSVMDGVDPWAGGNLNNAGKRADQAFESLREISERDRVWSWLSLAPHATQGARGLFGELKSQVLQYFPHEHLAGLELGDSELPEDACIGRDWLRPAMQQYHQAFFHASDAYILNPASGPTQVGDLGNRTTVLKLAAPTIEALRQAFLASDSRLRLALRRDPSGNLEAARVPDPLALDRPWLRSITVKGGTSFFGGSDPSERETVFDFNPDLTCIIGGRMSGKSTLLDGLRVAFDFPLPTEPDVREDVQGRAQTRFLSGNPVISEDVVGPVDPTAPARERWPALFFTQRELQQAVADQEGLRGLLFQLLPDRGDELAAQYENIRSRSQDLARLVPKLVAATQAFGVAEQDLAAATTSRKALERYEAVGASQFTIAQGDLGRIRAAVTAASDLSGSIQAATATAGVLTSPTLESERLRGLLDERSDAVIRGTISRATEELAAASTASGELNALLKDLEQRGTDELSRFRADLEQALATAGGSAEELNQFAALSVTAERFEDRRLAAEGAERSLGILRDQFNRLTSDRGEELGRHRGAMREVAATILSRFDGHLRVRITLEGVDDELDAWITSLRERGVTRWWHEAPKPLLPNAILEALDAHDLGAIGMSPQVAETFAEVMTEAQRWKLQAVHTSDRYILEFLVGTEYRPMEHLSGGQQVSLLLSLLLESDDHRPLVVDQPEEELDKAYLFETVLPALRRLKGQRQVIFVTHDANIVVNGDADHVIHLAADATHGWVVAQGAIEQPEIRNAILAVLDGGRDAFELRSRKYGF